MSKNGNQLRSEPALHRCSYKKVLWHPCQNAISIKLQSNFIETTLRHGCSPVNLLHIFRTPFSNNTSGGLLLCVTRLPMPWPSNLLQVCIAFKFFFHIFFLYHDLKLFYANPVNSGLFILLASMFALQKYLQKLMTRQNG